MRARSFELRPRISFRRGEYDGESNSFDKIKLSLKGRYTIGRTTFLPDVSYSHSSYDKTDPIFNTTRKTDSYQFTLLISYAAPFGLEDWAAQGIVSLGRGESNINFYDTESVSGGMLMTYLL